MRCPKCGYISFDNLEKCKSCKKDIAKAVNELSGTVFDTPAPLFLHFVSGETSGNALGVKDKGELEAQDTDILDFESLTGDSDQAISTTQPMKDTLDLDSEDDEVIDLDEIAISPDIEELELQLEPQEADSVVGRDDFQVSPPILLDKRDDDGEIDFDFSAIGLEEEKPSLDEQVPEPEPVSLEKREPEVAVVAEEPNESALGDRAAPVSSLSKSDDEEDEGLKDLKLDGLDLAGVSISNSDKPVARRSVGPSVKTGTALDEFEVDLGELFSEQK